MRAILQNYGAVLIDVSDRQQRSNLGAYYNAAGWYMRGGSSDHDAEYFASKIESMEGFYVDGVIIDSQGGEYNGVYVEGEPVMVDLDELMYLVNAGEFSDDPYEGWR